MKEKDQEKNVLRHRSLSVKNQLPQAYYVYARQNGGGMKLKVNPGSSQLKVSQSKKERELRLPDN